MTQLLRLLSFLTITGCFLQAVCYVPVPLVYRKAELALQRYSSRPEHNPIIYSLLNILIHNNQASAFVTTEAVDQSLESVKQLNSKDEELLHQILYDSKQFPNSIKPSAELKEDIQTALDQFFSSQSDED